MREDAVEYMSEEETLVEKLANWWHGFSLLGDGDDDSMMERVEEHQEQQQRLQPHRVTIVEDDDDSVSASLSCVSFSKKKKPLKLLRVNAESGDAKAQAHTKAWANPDPTTFMVRSKHYMVDKVKLPASCSLYRLVKCETVTFDGRVDHIAQHLEVPTASAAAVEAGKQVRLPPLLVIQLQMPMYNPVLFGEHDGESCSLIYYSELDPGVADMPPHAVAMAVRFMQGGQEEDGQATRDRLKLIPRIMNVEEWGREAGLSGTEMRLVTNYNGKPLLMRPQFHFYEDAERTYFEIDVDIHNYAYIARRAFSGYVPRLGPAVFENGFVVQGNNENELPEVLLMCARVYRVDFRRVHRMSL